MTSQLAHLTDAQLIVETKRAAELERRSTARKKTTREVEQLVATGYPQPDVPATVRALPAPKPTITSPPEATGLLDGRPSQTAADLPAEAEPMSPPSVPRSIVAPLAERKYLLKVTLGSRDERETDSGPGVAPARNP